MVETLKFTNEDLAMWRSYCDEQLFYDREQIRSALINLITYAETSDQTSPGIKQKLRFVTKTLRENSSFDRFGIIALLASHGNVCNVMKEVGILQAYALITNTAQENNIRSSFMQQLLRCLRLLRESAMEDTYVSSPHLEKDGYSNVINTHNYITYFNVFAPHIGLLPRPDPDVYSNGDHDYLDLELFFSKYTPDRIIDFVLVAINEKPRKISYQSAVTWFETNTPNDSVDSYEFLSVVFDMETGHLKREWAIYMLHKLGILSPYVDWQSIYSNSLVENAENEKAEVICPDANIPPPSLTLTSQNSISNDLRVPIMVRQVSREEEVAEQNFDSVLNQVSAHH